MAVCLFLGAVVNIAVAWACVLWSPQIGYKFWHTSKTDEYHYPGPYFGEELPPLQTKRIAIGFDEHNWSEDGLPETTILTGQSGLPFHGLRYEVSVICGQSGIGVTPIPHSDLYAEWREEPWRAIHWGLPAHRIPRWMRVGLDHRRLPLNPIPLGFIVNTLIYAGLIGGLGYGRRALRRRRGLCSNCAYDLAGLATCPECGSAAARA